MGIGGSRTISGMPIEALSEMVECSFRWFFEALPSFICMGTKNEYRAWVEKPSKPQQMHSVKQSVCYILFISRYMGPWQRLAAGSSGLFLI